jgi:hypothetical protein
VDAAAPAPDLDADIGPEIDDLDAAADDAMGAIDDEEPDLGADLGRDRR